jgi:hypothetical protein
MGDINLSADGPNLLPASTSNSEAVERQRDEPSKCIDCRAGFSRPVLMDRAAPDKSQLYRRVKPLLEDALREPGAPTTPCRHGWPTCPLPCHLVHPAPREAPRAPGEVYRHGTCNPLCTKGPTPPAGPGNFQPEQHSTAWIDIHLAQSACSDARSVPSDLRTEEANARCQGPRRPSLLQQSCHIVTIVA